jgi:hypothetical protein
MSAPLVAPRIEIAAVFGLASFCQFAPLVVSQIVVLRAN